MLISALHDLDGLDDASKLAESIRALMPEASV